MNIILFDNKHRNNLLPFTYTRPQAGIRIGILTIAEKWQHIFKSKISYATSEYLNKKYTLNLTDKNYFINASVLPNLALVAAIENLNFGEALYYADELIATYCADSNFKNNIIDDNNLVKIIFNTPIQQITQAASIFQWNEQEIQNDFNLITKNRSSAHISDTNKVIGVENIFVEAGAKIECSILNATNSKMYIGADAEIMEGSIIRGSLALCEQSTIKMGAKIYGATTIGPHCKVGGEINNSVIFGYSNKAHDGFMGNSVIGEWCNWGADSNNSNLKNNYEEVKLWNYQSQSFEKTGTQFCGLMMADHSKCGINTMFNTGTVVGVSANIFGAGFPRNYIADFTWGGAQGITTYQLNKAISTAKLVYARRGIEFDAIEQEIFTHIFNETQVYRKNI